MSPRSIEFNSGVCRALSGGGHLSVFSGVNVCCRGSIIEVVIELIRTQIDDTILTGCHDKFR